MPPDETTERDRALLATPIRDLGLTLTGGRLAPLIARFERELRAAGVTRLAPRFYLSTEWGVPFGTVSVSVPFYLARADLIALQSRQVGFLEGAGRGDFLRYLRHETGHAVNYAYRLHQRPDWRGAFGAIEADYLEDYRPEPFSRRFVCHLPGWYAQMHPDEDWSETFAVWLTPGYDWRAAYAAWPEALAKLELCDRLMREVNARDPDVTDTDFDEEVSTLTYTLGAFYAGTGPTPEPAAPHEIDDDDPDPALAEALDAPLRGIFEDFGDREDASSAAPRREAAALILAMEQDLATDAFRWTGCFPERVRPLVRQLADRAARLRQVYPADREREAVIAVTSLVTALAMDHVVRRGPLARSRHV